MQSWTHEEATSNCYWPVGLDGWGPICRCVPSRGGELGKGRRFPRSHLHLTTPSTASTMTAIYTETPRDVHRGPLRAAVQRPEKKVAEKKVALPFLSAGRFQHAHAARLLRRKTLKQSTTNAAVDQRGA